MAAEAINYAVNNGADVINASWGGYGASQAVRNAIAYARSRGVLFVAAAGNEGYDNDVYPLYPASYPLENILSVAATDRRDQLANFSNYGSNTVDLAAPGSEILSTWRGDNWVYLDGTSMASPFVAGAAALLQSAVPSASAIEVRESLLKTVSVLPEDSSDIISGGRLDADAALTDLLSTVEDDSSLATEAWTFVPYSIQTPHPYDDHTSKSWHVAAPSEAREIQLHFQRIDVEAGYDFVTLRDAAGNKVGEWTGEFTEVVTDPIEGHQALVSFYSDYSVTEWGFAISGYSWR
jgi:subtilisin family serine protease